MTTEKPIELSRDCAAVMVPSGERIMLSAGSTVWLTQALGGSYTVMTDHGYSVRIEGRDGDALGLAPPQDASLAQKPSGSIEEQIWNELRSCFDPEIPINIVELGLVYDCDLEHLDGGARKVNVRMTLTAPGCGMGDILVDDVRTKLEMIPTVAEADVDLVFDPPWNQTMMSEAARLETGML